MTVVDITGMAARRVLRPVWQALEQVWLTVVAGCAIASGVGLLAGAGWALITAGVAVLAVDYQRSQSGRGDRRTLP